MSKESYVSETQAGELANCQSEKERKLIERRKESFKREISARALRTRKRLKARRSSTNPDGRK
jgi:predicted AAA+ superfamily ATPase